MYNWADYMLLSVPKEFQAKSDIQLTWDCSAPMRRWKPSCSLAIPATTWRCTFLDTQIKAGCFRSWKSKLPNWKHLDPALLQLMTANDPGNEHAVPYMYGTVLIGFNLDKVKAALGADASVNRWDLVFKDSNRQVGAVGGAMLDSPGEILPIALHYLGLDPSSTQREDYNRAAALLLKIRPHVGYFHSTKYMADIANGNICRPSAIQAASTSSPTAPRKLATA